MTPVSPSLPSGKSSAMFPPEPAQPLHATMLSVLHEARRRQVRHEEYPLPVCELLLEIHAPAGDMVGDPCEGCQEPWPCKMVLGILGGLVPGSGPEDEWSGFA